MTATSPELSLWISDSSKTMSKYQALQIIILKHVFLMRDYTLRRRLHRFPT